MFPLCPLFSPFHVLTHSRSPASLSRSCALHPILLSLTCRWLIAAVLSRHRQKCRVWLKGEEAFLFFFSAAFLYYSAAVALPFTLIWRSYVDGFVSAEPHVRSDFLCFSFFHLAKIICFLQRVLSFSRRPLMGFGSAGLKVKAAFLHNIQLRLNSLIRINC